jgi:hypothetical protein
VWRCIPIIPVLGRLRQEDGGFETSLDYIVRCCLKKEKKASIKINQSINHCSGKSRMTFALKNIAQKI